MIAVLAAAAVLTVFVIVPLLAPLMLGDGRQRAQGWAMLTLITLTAMGLYLARGAPDVPSRPALFETAGPAFDKREAVKRERSLTQRLAQKPDDTDLMLELGDLQMHNGRLDQAIALLETAMEKAPGSTAIRGKLGAAHYAAALYETLMENDRSRAADHFEKAVTIAPADAPYREKLLKDRQEFQNES